MGSLEFDTENLGATERVLAGGIAVVGLMVSLVLGVVAVGFLSEWFDPAFVALGLGMWTAAQFYVRAWNLWSPWSPPSGGERP